MTHLLVDHASLAFAADRMRATVAAMQSRLDDLSGLLTPLAAEWSGSTQAAFAVARARWDTAMTGLTAALIQTQRHLVRANEEYRAADLRAAQHFH